MNKTTVSEVRLEDKGLASIEVVDDGLGVAPADFNNLCKDSQTSKLTELKDLQSLSTFGFRGQALHALATLGLVASRWD